MKIVKVFNPNIYFENQTERTWFAENSKLKIKLYRDQVSITDLENAGKRGKQCTTITITDWHNGIVTILNWMNENNFSAKGVFDYLLSLNWGKNSWGGYQQISAPYNGTTFEVCRSEEKGVRVGSPFMKTTFDLDKIKPHVSDKWEVGAICDESWGYEQTNIDFYCVVKITKKGTVTLMPMTSKNVGETGFMSNHVIPDEIIKTESPLQRRLKDGYKEKGLSVKGHGWCSLWDGHKQLESHYA